ncbi:tyrosine-protein kinase family protein [Erythrobacter litoralis]|uniref:CpsD/CapB family tyrosine-protein kinase n=1 Tax=Erythrobacter litoralis TaxID=39960 RepID=UPI002435A76D|nr:CpsD/CapB family tyrosine-protein kinase [Erythrobacter litoralis]MDG6079110.1 tyrosine-protein kinase family protein [Erythrobacter litoralis]
MNELSTPSQQDWTPDVHADGGYADHRFDSIEESGDYTFSDKLALLSGRGSLDAETISLLLSELLSQHVQNAKRGIAFCGASKDTGCSYMAANIAVAMALSGVRTILVDANMRDPAVQDYIAPVSDRGGLLQCLSDEYTTLQHVVHHDVIPNLSVLYAGGVSNDAGLLASKNADAVFSDCLRDYACTIVDTAPANRSSDAVRIANMVRYTLIVARKDKSFVADIKKLAGDIRQNNGEILGTFLNAY